MNRSCEAIAIRLRQVLLAAGSRGAAARFGRFGHNARHPLPLADTKGATMKKLGMLGALVAGAALAQPALAQNNSTYVGISGAAVYSDSARSLERITGGIHDESVPNGGKIYGGYMWDNLGVEFGYYMLGTYEIDNAGGAIQDELQTSAITVSGVYSAQMGAGYSFNARLGIAFTNAEYDCILACGAPFVDTTRRGTSGLLGIGFGWRAPGGAFSLHMDYDHIGSVQHAISTIKFKDAYDMISVGVRLNF
jgi:hypothetical protein